MTLYQEIKAAGIPVDNHESDLYFKSTPESRMILSRHPIHRQNAEAFTNQVSRDRWIDVPFAFDPFWERKGK